MTEQLQQLKQAAEAAIAAATTTEALQAVEVEFLGRKGKLTAVLRQLKYLPVEERKAVGEAANAVRDALTAQLTTASQRLLMNQSAPPIDVTVPGKPLCRGHIHPAAAMRRDVEAVFGSMGFAVIEGPELESEFFNFEGLNIPASHPARDMQDTFFITEADSDQHNRLVMRTHTSPVQVRAMQQYGAPLRAIFPGRVFRYEATDASHDTTFDQVEGLLIDKDIAVADLVGVTRQFLRALFDKELKIRLRPGYFPFTEPGFEVDVQCAICGGEGCSVCKQTGWIELMGAGLVHPNVLRAGGIDPQQYSGFAFGFGLTRLTMIRHGIDDIRLLLSGDMRFLQQF